MEYTRQDIAGGVRGFCEWSAFIVDGRHHPGALDPVNDWEYVEPDVFEPRGLVWASSRADYYAAADEKVLARQLRERERERKRIAREREKHALLEAEHAAWWAGVERRARAEEETKQRHWAEQQQAWDRWLARQAEQAA